MDKIVIVREYPEEGELVGIIALSQEAEIKLRRLSLDSGIPTKKLASLLVKKAAPYIELTD